MPYDDPSAWAQGAGALKSAFDAIRGLIGVVKDVRGLANPEQAKAITAAVDQAEAAAKVAEAEVAKALGYELCKCQFPPAVMLTVGYTTDRGDRRGGPVFECRRMGIRSDRASERCQKPVDAVHWNYSRHPATAAPKLSCSRMGFTVKQMVELVRAGLARAKAERVVAGRKSIEVARVRIAEAGGGLSRNLGHERWLKIFFATPGPISTRQT